MEGISPFQSGRPLLSEITADKLNRILAEIKRNRPVVAAPLSARVTGDGTHISIKQSLGGGTSTPTTPQPWDLIARVDPDADPEDETPDYLVTVRPGTLNGFLPTNWEIEETVSSDGTLYYAKAIVATDGVGITSVSIAIDTDPPVLQEPTAWGVPATVEKLFGLFSSGSVFRVIGSGSINLSSAVRLTTPTEDPAEPGELPFINYYALQ
jgi:hypothetical protein